ncbi:ABC transporter permease [Clostridium sp. 'deep sea']|uniref:ABC transporter permease n=1 Tax=Clostridium sp. 'deep sea' TaxID=2779445 RepID=UPI0018967F85|nr:ABC transporter permease [Clostridium sp. 'deep sea']QOR34984.1 ABC transporter permease [Clostridium sp. 'deep sea']
MRVYLRKRLISLIFVIIGATILSFILANISPIDPAEAFARRNSKIASNEQIATIREEMGLNKPIIAQYFTWVSKITKADFGTSLVTNKSVITEVKKLTPLTVKLVSFTMFLCVSLSIPLAIICVIYKNSLVDKCIRIVSLLGISIPSFWLGFILLYLFAVVFKVVPILNITKTTSVYLPAITLATPTIASSIRLLRATMLENMNTDYVTYLRARGISQNKIIYKHVLKNSLAPVITVFGQTIGYMVAGTAIVEQVFSWNGLGNYLLKAILARDLPVINAFVFLMAVVFVVFNLVADLINIMLNPQMVSHGDNKC